MAFSWHTCCVPLSGGAALLSFSSPARNGECSIVRQEPFLRGKSSGILRFHRRDAAGVKRRFGAVRSARKQDARKVSDDGIYDESSFEGNQSCGANRSATTSASLPNLPANRQGADHPGGL